MLIPAPCLRGDLVEVVHPAGVFDDAKVQSGIERLEEAGFVVRHQPLSGAGYLAGSDAHRLASLERAIVDPNVRALWCARGGYGSMRLLSQLPPTLLADHPTWLVGYSDITALHAWATRQGVVSVHGPMVQSLGDQTDLQSVIDAIAGTPQPLSGASTLRAGTASGRLVGGNLSLVCALLGTPHEVPLDEAILVLEEVGEAPYRLDRLLTQLELAGVPQRVAGVVIGQITRTPGWTPEAAAQVVGDRVRDWGVPCASGFDTGHGRPNRAWQHGAMVTLEATDAKATLRYRAATTKAPRAKAAAPARWSPRSALGRATALLEEALSNGTCSAIQVAVSRGDEIVLSGSHGATAVTPDARRAPVTADTRFDIASVTKAVSTSVLAGIALSQGLVTLDDRVPADLSASQPLLRDLLRHSSGLPAHIEVFREVRPLPEAERRAAAEARFAAVPAGPPGTQVYSDVGYIALGRWLERVLGASIPNLFARHVSGPLRLRRSGFGDGASPIRDRCAATEWCAWREATLQGIVHDENCQVLGGSAGHAGLFSTADEVARIARALIGFGPPLLDPSMVASMWSLEQRIDGGTYVLGWDTPSGARSNAGSRADREATTGHLGFTGTSLWIDRSSDVVVSLLTNRVHPTRDNPRIRDLRPAFHDAVFEALGL